MLLHEAIIQTIREAKKPLSAKEIADKLNVSKLYIKEDHSLIRGAQISARVKNYQTLFTVDRSATPIKIDIKTT